MPTTVPRPTHARVALAASLTLIAGGILLLLLDELAKMPAAEYAWLLWIPTLAVLATARKTLLH